MRSRTPKSCSVTCSMFRYGSCVKGGPPQDPPGIISGIATPMFRLDSSTPSIQDSLETLSVILVGSGRRKNTQTTQRPLLVYSLALVRDGVCAFLRLFCEGQVLVVSSGELQDSQRGPKGRSSVILFGAVKNELTYKYLYITPGCCLMCFDQDLSTFDVT